MKNLVKKIRKMANIGFVLAGLCILSAIFIDIKHQTLLAKIGLALSSVGFLTLATFFYFDCLHGRKPLRYLRIFIGSIIIMFCLIAGFLSLVFAFAEIIGFELAVDLIEIGAKVFGVLLIIVVLSCIIDEITKLIKWIIKKIKK